MSAKNSFFIYSIEHNKNEEHNKYLENIPQDLFISRESIRRKLFFGYSIF